MKKRGKLIVIVAPSGTGKSTLIAKLQKDFNNLKWSVSSTTRPMRAGEENGRDYFFITIEMFEELIKNDGFIEWAKVHSNYYGTSKKFVDDGLLNGEFLLFDIDVQGCDSIKKIYDDEAKIIFIEPPSVEELEKRLRGRATDKEEVILERISNAKKELKRKNDFDYLIMNDDVESAYLKLKAIVKEIMEHA